MTEQDLRFKVIDTIQAWEGATRGSPKHLEILNIYNLHKPLARGYAVKTGDAWCATTVSAAWIKTGISDWTGTECSCSRLIEIAKQKNIWVEADNYNPRLGDAVLYDWQDGADYASTDNTGAPDHIGIVVKIGMGAFDVIEGNKGNPSTCGRRTMAINGRYIRGFICPDYAAIAAELTKQEKAAEIADKAAGALRYNKISEMPTWARNDMKWLVDHSVLKGNGGPLDNDGRPADLDLSLDMIRMLIICKRMRG